MTKHRELLLVFVCVALAALVWWDNQKPAPDETRAVTAAANHVTAPVAETKQELDSNKPAPPAENVANGNPLASFDKSALQNWIERPLFAPSRKWPETKAATAPAIAPPPPADFQLLGVIRDNDRAIALLRSQSGGSDVRVEVGDMISGWHVAAVEWTSVTLKRDDDTSQIVRFSK